MYLLPLLDVMGKRPVWSVYMQPVASMAETYMQLVRSWVGGVVCTLACVGMVCLVVDRMFLNVWRRWPLTVASDFGRCFRTISLVSPGHVVRNVLSMAVVRKADVVGLKQH